MRLCQRQFICNNSVHACADQTVDERDEGSSEKALCHASQELWLRGKGQKEAITWNDARITGKSTRVIWLNIS